ncbi:MAG: hypothetical protein E6K45_07285 [Gammaproteobacteria bacterium]|nr:MAG: hypothetical protein E6K45_07285 [Gammaproteobacteria bacterium]
MRRAICLAALGAAWLAAGCGQKGPLYLPDKNTRAVTTPSAQPTSEHPRPPPHPSRPRHRRHRRRLRRGSPATRATTPARRSSG